MGFQVGSVKLHTGNYEAGYLINGTYFCTFKEFESLDALRQRIAQIIANGESARSSLRIEDVSLTPRDLGELHGVRVIRNFSAGGKIAANVSTGAKDAEITSTLAGEVFKRFSAYEKDFRVTATLGLVPGTYATTEEDAKNVHNGKQAVARYALPNKQSANKVFTIKPYENTRLQRGIAEPANDEPGGGVEVIFVDGTHAGTVSGPEIIAEG